MTRKTFILGLLTAIFVFLHVVDARAQESDVPSGIKPPVSDAFRATNYPIPRFVSLRPEEVFVRTGPGTKYPVEWIYRRSGLPVEITLEFENWRKIKDFEGAEGWVHHSMLSGRRAGHVQAQEPVPLYRDNDAEKGKLAMVEPGSILVLEECGPVFCKIKAQGFEGWIERKFVWGIYEGENFD
jgi:SH3-like domain-containing protein